MAEEEKADTKKIRLFFRRFNSCQITEDNWAKWTEMKSVEVEMKPLDTSGCSTPWELLGYEVIE
ncbi:MAG: hypothetical protein MJ176_03125 [Treponema sp.]|nr:hypothetical protein [Treponema sp.]